MEHRPSRFVGAIEAALKEMREMEQKRTEKKPAETQLSLF